MKWVNQEATLAMQFSLSEMWHLDTWTWNFIERGEISWRSDLSAVTVLILTSLFHPLVVVVSTHVSMWARGGMRGQNRDIW